MSTQQSTPRPTLPAWTPLAALAAVALIGGASALLAHTWVQAVAVWPVGLLTGAALASRPATRPVVLLAGGALGAGTAHLLDVDGVTALAYGLGAALQAGLAATVLLRGVRTRTQPSLRSKTDLRRWLVAGTLGPAVGVPVFLGIVLADGGEVRPVAAVLILLSSVLSHLLLTPLFLRIEPAPQRVDVTERALQWAAVGAGTIVIFVFQDDVAWAFGLAPLLVWGALRLPLREMVVQLAVTCALVLTLAVTEMGPFAIGGDTGMADITAATQLQLCLVGGVLLVVPYTLIAQQLRELSSEAHRERELVRRIMDSAHRTAIIGTDRRGRITLFNRGAETLLGYRADEVLGHSPELLLPRAELQTLAEAAGTAPEFHRIARALTSESAEPRDWRLRRKSGEVRTHSVTLTQMRDEDGAVVGYVCTSEDVTARVQRQDALLAALLTEREAVERLEQADRMKDALVSTVSHELRTPLTSILGYTTMLVDGDLGDLSPTVQQTMERILGNGERLRSLVEDLLVLSRVNAGALDLEAQPLDLRDVVRTAHEVVAPSLAQRRLDLRIELPDESALVDGDVSMLERVVLNLFTNALKFTPDGGQVVVTVTLETDEVVLEVSDTGLGIPVEEQDQLFTQFFRSSVAKREAIQGTGLGLSIARAIVDQHGGVIGATSEPGIGSTFLVVLPRLAASGSPRHRRGETTPIA
ncbi:ATP-binding protein [Nocardioides zeae]|uniref:histidine kinase n=1 Tax=Nocardioides imazamoxiresistens TaxID=3231893 RepID=A0ABU3PRT0_9ACTN|nr:ATP-binding protein [Nocardioides zeae]MDT9591935.1 ATP-binding protein [Nocardioides zeae]